MTEKTISMTNLVQRLREKTPEPSPLPAGEVSATRRSGKSGQVRALLARAEGATIAQLCDTTGWQRHTMRAALTGLRKKGLSISSTKVQGAERVYRVVID